MDIENFEAVRFLYFFKYFCIDCQHANDVDFATVIAVMMDTSGLIYQNIVNEGIKCAGLYQSFVYDLE